MPTATPSAPHGDVEPAVPEMPDDHAAAGVPDGVTPFQRKMWRAQRIAWRVMMALVVAALFGAFGDGPLTDATARSATGHTTVRWYRVVRAQAPFDLELRSTRARTDRIGVAVSPSLARHFDAVRLVPDAEAEIAAGDAMLWGVAVVPGGPVRVRITAEVRTIGFLRGTVRLGDDDPVAVSLLVLP
jgi:hypothetical protein